MKKYKVKFYREVEVTEEEAEEWVMFQARLAGDQIENVNAALETAQEMTGSEVKSHLLDMICLEFQASCSGSPEVNLAKHIKRLERVFGVRLIPCKSEKMATDVLEEIKKIKA